MSKLEKIKLMLSELLELNMSSATTDKGVIYYNDDVIKVGTDIYIKNDNDIKIHAEDGVYELDNKLYTVTDGKVSLIEDKPLAVVEDNTDTQETETVDETDVQEVQDEDTQVDDVQETETVEETDVQETQDEETEVVEDENELDTLRSEVDVLKALVEDLRKEIDLLKGKPVAMSATEQFKAMQNTDKKGINRYIDALTQ